MTKRAQNIIVVVSFAAVIWMPLLLTPYTCREKGRMLKQLDERVPVDPYYGERAGWNCEQWTHGVQTWYEDSFAFRGKLMQTYSLAHWVIHSHMRDIRGADGFVMRRERIEHRLAPLNEIQVKTIQARLMRLKASCRDAGVECLFVFIPAKDMVYPEVAPRWIQSRDLDRLRPEMVRLIKEAGFPMVDLTLPMRQDADASNECFFHGIDLHWNLLGAESAYSILMPELKKYVAEARRIDSQSYVIQVPQDPRLFLMPWGNAPYRPEVVAINLPPVRVVPDGREELVSLRSILREEDRVDVYCPDAGERTVVFIGDSFMNHLSLFMNHSFGHTVYLNCTGQGAEPATVVQSMRPDLLVIALEESLMEQYLYENKDAGKID